MAGIELINVHKQYVVDERPVKVLNGISLKIPEKHITVILGRSGCGKTTLLRLTGGLEQADEGEIRYGLSHKTAFVFQEPRLMPWLNVWNNVTFGLEKKDQDQEKIERIIAAVGLSGFEKAYPSQLSGGEAQRVGIVRALINEPAVIFADEPTGALNSAFGEQVLNTLSEVNKKGQSIVVVTHDVKTARRADRVVYLKDGMICGECRLGTYTSNDMARHEKLNAFLTEMGW